MPGLGIQVVTATVDGAPILIRGHDFYCWHPDQGRWWGADVFGVFDYLQRGGWCKVIFGRTIPTEAHNELMIRAMKDHGLIVEG